MSVKLRQINVRRLCLSGIVYRILVTSVNALFFAVGVRYLVDSHGPIFSAICWNLINMGLYYLYHYWFLRFFRMEKEPSVAAVAKPFAVGSSKLESQTGVLQGEVA